MWESSACPTTYLPPSLPLLCPWLQQPLLQLPQILKYAIRHCLPTRRQKKEEHVTGVIRDWVWSRLMLPAACPPPAWPPMTLRDLLFLPGSPQPARIDIQESKTFRCLEGNWAAWQQQSWAMPRVLSLVQASTELRPTKRNQSVYLPIASQVRNKGSNQYDKS